MKSVFSNYESIKKLLLRYKKYLIVLGAGVFVILITLVVSSILTTPQNGSDPQASAETKVPDTTLDVQNTGTETDSFNNVTDAEPSDAFEESTQASVKKSTHSKSSIVLSQEVPGEIVDSLYQKVNLDWINAFLIIMYTHEVKTDERYPEAPSCMSIVEIADAEHPIIMIGGRTQEDGCGHYTFYGYQDDRLYRLYEFEGYAGCSPESSLFTLQYENGTKETFLFHDMNFYRQDSVTECEPLPLTVINDGSVYTVENLPDYIQWLGKGGDTE